MKAVSSEVVDLELTCSTEGAWDEEQEVLELPHGSFLPPWFPLEGTVVEGGGYQAKEIKELRPEP